MWALQSPDRTFLGDQRIGGPLIGNPQQRLRQAQQGHAFIVGQAELQEKGVQGAGAVTGRPAALDQRPRPVQRFAPCRLAQRPFGLPHEILDRAALVQQRCVADGAAQLGEGGGLRRIHGTLR